MKKATAIFILIILVFFSGNAQNNKTIHYCRQILDSAYQNLKDDKHIDMAIKELKNLEICDYNNRLLKERSILQDSIFRRIQKQNEKLEFQTSQANKLYAKAKKDQIKTQKISDTAVENLNTALFYYLIWKAKDQVVTDPTMALGYAKEAWNLFLYKDYTKVKIAEKEISNIFSDNCFYKTIINGSQTSSTPTAIARSPNSDTIAIGYNNGYVQLWYPDKDEFNNYISRSEPFYCHYYHEITSIAFSPDGKTILTASNDSTAILWDLKGDSLIIFRHDCDSVNAVAFSPGGDSILTGSENGTVRLWSIRSRKELKSYKNWHASAISSVTFSPDGNLILTSSKDRTVRLWDLVRDSLLKDFRNQFVTCVAFSPDGNFILTGSKDKTARLWDLNAKSSKDFVAHRGAITSIAFSPDGKNILTGSEDRTALLWDMNGKKIKEFKAENEVQAMGNVYAVMFTYDGKSVLTASGIADYGYDNSVRSWYLNRNNSFDGNSGAINSIAFSPEGDNILTGAAEGSIQLWNLEGKKIRDYSGHTDKISSVKFSPGGEFIIAGSLDGTARMWNSKGDSLTLFKKDSIEDEYYKGINGIAVSPDGKNILTGTSSKEGVAHLWDLNGNIILQIKDNQKIRDRSGVAILWKSNLVKLKELTGHTDSVISVAFSPDGNFILTGSKDSTARLWNLKGDSIGIYKGHRGMVTSVTFSPDGNFILTGSKDSTARLWNLKGHSSAIYKGHNGIVTSVAFSSDGNKILTGSEDSTARLWNLKGDSLGIYKGHKAGITSVWFAPDDKKILTGSKDSTVILWKINGDVARVFRNNGNIINYVNSSSDGEEVRLITPEMLRIWNLKKNTFKDDRIQVNFPFAFSSEKNLFLTAAKGLLNNSLMNESDEDDSKTITAVAFLPSGTILTGNAKGKAALWNRKAEKIMEFTNIDTLSWGTSAVTDVACSPNGKTIIVGYDNGSAVSFNIDGVEFQRYNDTTSKLSYSYNSITSLALSPAGDTLVAGFSDGSVRLWDFKSGEWLKTFSISSGERVNSVAFSPDGRSILAGYEDGKVRVWDVQALALDDFDKQNKIEPLPDSVKENKYGLIKGKNNYQRKNGFFEYR